MVLAWSDFSRNATCSILQGVVVAYFAQNFTHTCAPFQTLTSLVAMPFKVFEGPAPRPRISFTCSGYAHCDSFFAFVPISSYFTVFLAFTCKIDFLKFEFIGVTLVNKIIQVSVHSSIIHHLYIVLCLPPQVKSPSITIHPPNTFFYIPQVPMKLNFEKYICI